MVPVPCSAKELVAKSEDKNVLDHLLAQVMINTVELILSPVWCKCALELSGAWEIFAERLLDLLHRG